MNILACEHIFGFLCVFTLATRVGSFESYYSEKHVHQNPLLRIFRREVSAVDQNVGLGPPCTTTTFGSGHCTTASICAPWYNEITTNPEFKCKLEDGKDGYCCPSDNPTLRRNKFSAAEEPVLRSDSHIDSFGYNEVKKAEEDVKKEMDEWTKSVEDWVSKGYVVQQGSPSDYHAAFFISTPETTEEGVKALRQISAARQLQKKYSLAPDIAGLGMRQFSVLETSLADTCRPKVECDPNSFYRTIDGTCNNLETPFLGKENTPFTRILAPAYEEGIWAPRVKSVTGGKLPSARKISSRFEPEKDRPLNGVTLLTMIFGQFVDHDITLGAIFEGKGGERISCCTAEGKHITDASLHQACFPIDIPLDDKFYSQFGQECMNFVRALPSPRLDCNYGYAQQVNQITHYLDSSMVYGSTKEMENRLRGPGGKLRVTRVTGLDEPLLPQNRFDLPDSCTDAKKEQFCFVGGDSRVNENIILTIVQTVFLREHNRVVDELQKINPQWNDEKLYQETRRIVNAEINHIIYNEWLPLVVGPTIMYEYGITPLTDGYRHDYDDSVNPSATSEFNFAFRFGHSLLQGHMDLYNERLSVEGGVQLRSTLLNTLALYRKRVLENMLRGLLTQKSQSFDSSFTEDVQHHLFSKGRPFGLDLVALNIQRGRDHAVRSYNAYREFCHGNRATTFDDLLGSMSPENVERLKSVYDHVDDIDLFIGGVCEEPAAGAIVGPTFRCIITDQFARLKKGDRFFYDLGDQKHSFNPHQLREIRKVTMSRVLCDNVEELKRVQPLAFYEASNINDIVPCDSYLIPNMDLLAGWKE